MFDAGCYHVPLLLCSDYGTTWALRILLRAFGEERGNRRSAGDGYAILTVQLLCRQEEEEPLTSFSGRRRTLALFSIPQAWKEAGCGHCSCFPASMASLPGLFFPLPSQLCLPTPKLGSSCLAWHALHAHPEPLLPFRSWRRASSVKLINATTRFSGRSNSRAGICGGSLMNGRRRALGGGAAVAVSTPLNLNGRALYRVVRREHRDLLHYGVPSRISSCCSVRPGTLNSVWLALPENTARGRIKDVLLCCPLEP